MDFDQSCPHGGDHPHELDGSKINAVTEPLYEANRIARAYIIVNRLLQKRQLRTTIPEKRAMAKFATGN